MENIINIYKAKLEELEYQIRDAPNFKVWCILQKRAKTIREELAGILSQTA